MLKKIRKSAAQREYTMYEEYHVQRVAGPSSGSSWQIMLLIYLYACLEPLLNCSSSGLVVTREYTWENTLLRLRSGCNWQKRIETKDVRMACQKYANKAGMMYAKPHPYIFFTLQLDSAWKLLGSYLIATYKAHSVVKTINFFRWHAWLYQVRFKLFYTCIYHWFRMKPREHHVH